MCNMVLFILLMFFFSWASASVSYDHRAILINGKRRILISGSIHYPRSTPEVLLLQLLHIMPTWFTGSLSGSLCFCMFFKAVFDLLGLLKMVFGLFFALIEVKVLLFLWGFLGVADVAGSYTKGQRWRLGCYSDLCFLEWP